MAEAAALMLVICEIMYNPDSDEGDLRAGIPNQVEWVEVFNPGETAIDVSGYFLLDEDGRTAPAPKGSSIPAEGAAVLIPSDTTAEQFRDAWGKDGGKDGGEDGGEDVQIIRLGEWDSGLYNLANGPSETNERLRLCTPDGRTVDQVNYDDEGDWPSDSPDGASIYLLPDALHGDDPTALNDDGRNWRRSEKRRAGARKNEPTEIFDGYDVGSPGDLPE